MKNCILIHYSEIGLKGNNRQKFESWLRKNTIRALSDFFQGPVRRNYGRILILLPKNYKWDLFESRLRNIFGISYFSPAIITDLIKDIIISSAIQFLSGSHFESFKVLTKRANKDFAYSSMQINEFVGQAIQKQLKKRVDLNNPDITIFIEIFNKNALIFTRKIKGPGGLPIGVNEKAVSLISSGIDSPVASWKVMRRGIKIIFVHFHSVPATSRNSIVNTSKIVEILTKYQFVSKLYIVPFLEIQKKIAEMTPPEFRILLYRRAMIRVSHKIAQYENASALVTGENIGQVSSQTLHNICSIGHSIDLPIIRPLAGEDKSDIIKLAKLIGTYNYSIRPYDDCCTLFIPEHPELFSDYRDIDLMEAHLETDKLYDKVLTMTQKKIYDWKILRKL